MKMGIRAIHCLTMATAMIFPASNSFSQQGALTPAQVYEVMHSAIRETFGINDQDPTADVWLSIVPPGDFAQVNDLANFCPSTKPVIDTFARQPKLDAIYEKVIKSLASPQKAYSPAYFKAKAVIFKDGHSTPEYQKYLSKSHEHTKAVKALVEAKGSAERSQAAQDLREADQAWVTEGYKAEIEAALATMATEEYRTGIARQVRRIAQFDTAETLGIAGTDEIDGAFVAPQSKFSPSADTWAASTAWVTVSYDSTQIEKRYSKEESDSRGFGGLSLGFLNLVGSGGDKGKVEHKIDNVYKLSYSYEVMRATIRRGWLDSPVFFEPFDWTWKKNTNTKVFPYVSVARDAKSFQPMPSLVNMYDNKVVACAMMPVEVVVARNRKITATVSKDDYTLIEQSGHRQGGATLFGIIGGGGSKDWSSVKTSEDGNTVTFTVASDGIAVIGLISQILPPVPQPNSAEKWPGEAWLPPAQVQ